jgi:uncharacterized lipoprotein YddW (UPF0748 family)
MDASVRGSGHASYHGIERGGELKAVARAVLWPLLWLLFWLLPGLAAPSSARYFGVERAAPGQLRALQGQGSALHTRCPPFSGEPRRQLRGVWIASVENRDWPSRPGLPVRVQQEEFRRLLDQARAIGLNAVFVQVRPEADALYPSRYAPWSAYLTGVQGRSPGYDPLAFMVAEAHKRNLEFHAWFNPYRLSLHDNLEALAPSHPARLHPTWVVHYGGRLYFDPGLPEVRRLLVATILEVVGRYAIDGVHLDDYFYPYPLHGQDFPDAASYRRYGAAHYRSKADWRRASVNLLIAELSRAIHRLRPEVKFGISPFGVWRNRADDPSGSATAAAVQDYDDLYADTRTWIRHQWIDYLAPQLYWPIGFQAADYAVLVPWWAHEVQGTRVQLYIGQAVYKIGSGGAWNDPGELLRHLVLNRSYGAVKGDIFFRIGDLLRNPLGFTDRLRRDFYQHPALIPLMPWLGGRAPATPRLLAPSLEVKAAGRASVLLRWVDGAGPLPPAYYAVYRLAGGPARDACALADPSSLLATTRRVNGEPPAFVDRSVVPGQIYTYYVTALDRLHHESPPGKGETLRLPP